MATDAMNKDRALRYMVPLLIVALVLVLDACTARTPLVGLVYTHVKLPLTLDLNITPMPSDPPRSDRIVEIREPITQLGLSTRVKSDAIGEIARHNGIKKLYYADQEIFNILGIWKSHRVILYGDSGEVKSPKIKY